MLGSQRGLDFCRDDRSQFRQQRFPGLLSLLGHQRLHIGGQRLFGLVQLRRQQGARLCAELFDFGANIAAQTLDFRRELLLGGFAQGRNLGGSVGFEALGLVVEAPFGVALDNGYSIRGRIDAVYVDDGRWEVVDFKSGRPGQDPSRVVQLEAYAVAVNEVDFGIPAPEIVDVTFAYLGGGLHEVVTRADPPWVDAARAHLLQLTGAIEAGQFPETPGPWCGNCDFLRFCPAGRREVGV